MEVRIQRWWEPDPEIPWSISLPLWTWTATKPDPDTKLRLRRKRKKNLLLLLHLLYLTVIFRFRKEYLEILFVLHFIVKFGRLFYIFLYQISFQIVWQSRVTSHELRVAEFRCELIRLKVYENSLKKVFRDLTWFVTESQIIADIAKISQTIFFSLKNT